MSNVNIVITRYIQPSIRQNKPFRQRTCPNEIRTCNFTEHAGVFLFLTVFILALVALRKVKKKHSTTREGAEFPI